jgi:hypothetical protein
MWQHMSGARLEIEEARIAVVEIVSVGILCKAGALPVASGRGYGNLQLS